ncbi:MAG: hypothetical protein EP344_16640 [Bacteroidetes bacterium]|nr:MAG: hypothetical protein EP344_16640 [Bacteroidota bacterium]
MFQKLLLSLLCFLVFGVSASAQVPPPCPLPLFPGAESCQQACVYCDFDGYTGTNNGVPSGGNTVCGQITIHNDQWFAFVAGTEFISIDILTSNCQTGDGLQAAFFDDCNEDAITCNPGVGGGGGMPLNLSYGGFVPGQTYWLMIDGYIADICDYEIDVIAGSVSPPPPGVPTGPQGPTEVCPGAVVEYTIPPVTGAGYYNWNAPAGSQINGGPNTAQFAAPEGTTVTVTFGNLGGQVCVQVGNACFPPQQACTPVVNQPIPPTPLEPIVVCFEDRPFFWEEEPYTVLNAPGTYTLTSSPYTSYLGCDSTVRQTITIKNQIITNIGIKYICEDGCFNINGVDYCQPGTYQETFTSYQDCDSLVQFTLLTVPTEALIDTVTEIISCTNPTLTLNSPSTGPNITFAWTNANWDTLGQQSMQTVNAGGLYNLIISNSLGNALCYDTASVTIDENIMLPDISAQGGELNCFPGGASVTLQGMSVTPGVNYLWTGPGITPANQNQQNPVVTVAGDYILAVSNPANNCTAYDTVQVIGNNIPPSAQATGDTINCLQANITINGETNAGQPSFLWTGPGINTGNETQEDPVVSVSGLYTVTITETSSGCSSTATATVIADTDQPTANAGNDLIINCFQPTVSLEGDGSPGNVEYLWTGPGITPANQNMPMPVVDQPGNYVLVVTNPDNGCTQTDVTVVTAALTPPVADAGLGQTINCNNSSVSLGGSGSSQGPEYEAVWTGPAINPGNQGLYNPVVDQPGLYSLVITNTTTGCTATDDVTIDIDVAVPAADAGDDQILTCSTTNGVTLNGDGQPANVTFQWSGPGIGANNQTQQTPQVSQPGTYVLLVTNPGNGCTQTDTVQVLQDANVPIANAGQDLTLNCSVTTVDIDASGSSSGPDFVYLWTGPGITPANANLQNPSGLSAPGTYSLLVTDTTNNCENTDILVIAIDTLSPAANAGSDLVLNCYNNSTATLDGSASSTGANFTLLWSGPAINVSNQNNPLVDVSVPGTYDLLITNTLNNCTATDQAVVTADLTPPVADAGADQIIDCVVTSTQIGGASSAGNNFTYNWAGPDINAGNQSVAQPIVSVEGLYELTVTNTDNGCTALDATQVTLNATYPTSAAGPDLVITCAEPTQVLDGSGSSSGPDFQTSWSGPGINAGNQSNLSPTINLPGIYILTIIDITNSCQTQDTVEVQENTVLPTASAGNDQNLDCQTITVTLDGNGSSSGTAIVYLWTGPAITPGNQNIQNPDIDLPGTYMLLVTDTDNGCTATDEAVITQDIAVPVASAGMPFVLTCLANTQAIDGSGSSAGPEFDYLWQGPGINTSNFDVQNPMVSDSGTYVLIVTNTQNHCTATDQVFIDMDQDLPATSAGPDQTLTCQNDTLTLDGTASETGTGITYAWSGPGIVTGTQSGTMPLIFLPGTYTITVTNTATGCSDTDIVSIDQNTLPPIASAGEDQVLTCSTAGGVTISAADSDTGAGFTLTWSGPGITVANMDQVEPLVNVPGVYTVLITNTINGCTSTDEVDVTQDQGLPVADAGPDQTISCAIQQVSLDATSSTAAGPIDYLWSGPGINAGNQDLAMPVVDQSGIYTVQVTNTVNGCQATDQVEVFLDTAPPLATATGDIITCTSPVVTLASTSSVTGSSFMWTGPDINLGNMNLQNPPVGDPGTYTVVVTAPNGCTGTATAIVEIDADVPTGSATGTELNCSNNGQSTISGTVTTAGATFQWTGPNGFNSNVLSPVVSEAGIYILTLTSANGCTKTYDAEVTANFTPPAAVATVNDLLDCNTTTIVLNGSASSSGSNITYAWSTTTGNIVSGASTTSPTVDAAGVYTLVVTNLQNGCTSSDDVLVQYDPAVPTGFNLTVQNIRCFGETNGFIAITGIEGGTEPFQFSFNGGTASGTAQFSQLNEGLYSISLLDANGCTLDTSVTITAPGALEVMLEDDVLVELGETVTVTATIFGTTPIESVEWNPVPPCGPDCLTYDTLPTHSYLQTITVKDSNGCVSTDRQLIQVDRSRRIYVPNVFNPDSNDPLNSFLMVQGGTDVRAINTWQIFDRWGNAIFSQDDFQPNDPTYAWDGKARGESAASAVYVWYIEVEFIDGEVELFEGDVTLIRQ